MRIERAKIIGKGKMIGLKDFGGDNYFKVEGWNWKLICRISFFRYNS